MADERTGGGGGGDWVTCLLCACVLLYIVMLDFLCGCYLAVVTVSGLLDVDYFFRRVSVDWIMATDGAAVMGERTGMTFGVKLVFPWDAPEAVVDLQSEGMVDLGTIPDVTGLVGRQPGAAGCRVLQGRDTGSVRVRVPDSLGLEQNFHDMTIVDMGDLPEPSVSFNELSMLHRKWPPAILHHMVWLQHNLEVMCAEAKKRFRSTRPGSCSYCGTWIKCDMYRH